jgi:hypothetical protein
MSDDIIILMAAALGMLIFVFFMLVMVFNAIDKSRREDAIAQAKVLYNKALDLVQSEPDDPVFAQKALDAGRLYYGLLMPDTYTQHYVDGVPTGTSGHQNNAAGREATIAADVQVRRIKKGPGEAAEKQCPRCAERIKSMATICRFCGVGLDAMQQVQQI